MCHPHTHAHTTSTNLGLSCLSLIVIMIASDYLRLGFNLSVSSRTPYFTSVLVTFLLVCCTGKSTVYCEQLLQHCIMPCCTCSLLQSINQSIYFAINGHRPLTNHTSSTNITTGRKAKLYKLCRYRYNVS